jgi:hypothetical protein
MFVVLLHDLSFSVNSKNLNIGNTSKDLSCCIILSFKISVFRHSVLDKFSPETFYEICYEVY